MRCFFRDTAHGLLAWALATLIMATFVTLASIATAGVAAAAPDTCRRPRPQLQLRRLNKPENLG